MRKKGFIRCPLCSIDKNEIKGVGCSFCNEIGKVSVQKNMIYVRTFKKNRKNNIIKL